MASIALSCLLWWRACPDAFEDLVLGFDVSVTIGLPGVVPLKSLGVPGKERSKVFNLVSLDALMIASWPGAIAIAHSNNDCFRR